MKEVPYIWMNGKLVNWKDANVHILTHAMHYGSSFFEGLRSYHTEKGVAVLALEAHMKRLVESAKIYRATIPYSLSELNQAVIDTIKGNKMTSCYIRPLVYRGYGEMGVNPLGCPVDVSVAVWEWGAYLGKDGLENGVDVMVSSWNRISPNTLPGVSKAGGQYLNSQLAKMEAITNGYADAIMLDQNNFVSEGSGANLFFVKDGELHTTPTQSSILSGITRKIVIQLAHGLGYSVKETVMTRGELYHADELFFTGTAAEITPIKSVDRIQVGEGKRGPITKQIQDLFFEMVTKGTDPHGYLTFI